METAENEVVARLRTELGLRPGIVARLPAGEAIQLAGRLEATSMEVVGGSHRNFQLRGDLAPSIAIDDDRLSIDFNLRPDLDPDDDFEEGPATTSATKSSGSPGGGSAGPESVHARVVAWRVGRPARRRRVRTAAFGLAPALRRPDRGPPGRARSARTGSARPYPDLALLCDDLDEPPPPSLEGLRPLLAGFDGIPTAEIDADLEDVLRDYQRQGVDWLVFLRRAGLGALLADDMGLGKTLQALCAIDGRTLVVAPTSVLHGWIREIERFRPRSTSASITVPVDGSTRRPRSRSPAMRSCDRTWSCSPGRRGTA